MAVAIRDRTSHPDVDLGTDDGLPPVDCIRQLTLQGHRGGAGCRSRCRDRWNGYRPHARQHGQWTIKFITLNPL